MNCKSMRILRKTYTHTFIKELNKQYIKIPWELFLCVFKDVCLWSFCWMSASLYRSDFYNRVYWIAGVQQFGPRKTWCLLTAFIQSNQSDTISFSLFALFFLIQTLIIFIQRHFHTPIHRRFCVFVLMETDVRQMYK